VIGGLFRGAKGSPGARPRRRGRGRHGGPQRERLGGGGGGGDGTSRHIRASERAGGGHIDIDPLPRYEMAHWPAMAAASLRCRERARGLEGAGRRRPGRKCHKFEAPGAVLSLRFSVTRIH
jgi:hypothetical protein